MSNFYTSGLYRHSFYGRRGDGRGSKPPPFVPDIINPTITSAAAANCAEGVVLAHSLTASEVVTWTIVGGADQAKFEISGTTLRWASNGVKDYENPDDVGTNNTYVVNVRATDVASNTADQTITITVTDVLDTLTAPVLSDKLSGWTTGDNPPAWTSTYTVDPLLDNDRYWVRARWRMDAGAWTTEDEIQLVDILLYEGEFEWPLLAAADLSDGGFFEVQEQMILDFDEVGEIESAWSNIWDDELDEIVIEGPTYVPGYSGGQSDTASTHTFSDVAFIAGIPCVSVGGYYTDTVTLTPSGGGSPIALTQRITDGSNDRATIYSHTTTITAGDYDVEVAHTAPNNVCHIHTGTLLFVDPAPTDTETRAEGYGDGGSFETGGAITVPSPGLALALIICHDATTVTWLVGTEQSEVSHGGLVSSVALLTTTGTPEANTSFNTGFAAMAAMAVGE